VARKLSTAEELLTGQINADQNSHNAYANRSLVLARRCDWDNALRDARQVKDIHHQVSYHGLTWTQSLSIQPSLSGYISKAIALCGKMEFSEATEAFDLALTFTTQDSNKSRLITLVEARKSLFASFLLHPLSRLLRFSMQINNQRL